jgi:Fe(3+) dicitrate transport protein
MLKMSFEPKSSMYQRFELKMGYTNLDANETYTGVTDADFRQTPNRRYAGTRFDEIESTHTRNYLRHFLEINKNTSLVTTAYGNTFSRSWQKLNKVGGVDIDEAIMTTAGLGIIKGNAAGKLEVKDNNRTYYLYGIQSNLSHKMKIGETDHKLDIGVRYHYDQIRRLQNKDTYKQDANGYITSHTSTMYGEEGNKLQFTHATSLNVSDQIKFKKLTFTPGIRAEHIHAKLVDYNDDTDGYLGDVNQKIIGTVSENYGMIAGGANLKFDVYEEGGQDFDLFGGINRGVSPPSPSGSAGSQLREENSVGYELGMRYADAPKAFSTELIFFLTNISDLIIPKSVGGSGSGGTVQAGDVRTRGIEFAVNYDHGLRKGWKLKTPMYIAATYTNAEFTDAAITSSDPESIWSGAKNGNELPYITPEVISMGFGVIYEKFNANLDFNYNGDTFADAANQSSQVSPTGTADARYGKVDAYHVLDATIGWQFNKNVRMFSNFKNITNQKYMVSRQPIGARPGLPFSMMAGLEFDL